jgi:transcriptional regulator GlxA family with amidase domain
MPALLALRRDHHYLDGFELDERLHDLAARLLRQHHRILNTVHDLPFARAATRDEIYRRLYRARDTMLALLDQPLTRDELAAVVHLSPNHFLRSFKRVFHETPYQYLRRHRLEKARHLLEDTSLSVTEICFTVGYSSLGSFSSAFTRHFGVPPSIVRQNGDFGEASPG